MIEARVPRHFNGLAKRVGEDRRGFPSASSPATPENSRRNAHRWIHSPAGLHPTALPAEMHLQVPGLALGLK